MHIVECQWKCMAFHDLQKCKMREGSPATSCPKDSLPNNVWGLSDTCSGHCLLGNRGQMGTQDSLRHSGTSPSLLKRILNTREAPNTSLEPKWASTLSWICLEADDPDRETIVQILLALGTLWEPSEPIGDQMGLRSTPILCEPMPNLMYPSGIPLCQMWWGLRGPEI